MLNALFCRGFFKSMEKILLMFKVLFFLQDSKVEDLSCGASSGSERSLFFNNYLFSLTFKAILR